MATKVAKPTVVSEEHDEAEKRGKRMPDYTVLVRQQPQRGSDGKLYRSSNFSVIGAGWRSEKVDETTGETIEYIGVKVHVPVQLGEDGLLLRTYREKN